MKKSNTKLSKTQRMLLGSLIALGLDETRLKALMLLLWKDEKAMIDLIAWIHFNNPNSEEVMSHWVAGYLLAHPEKQNLV